MERERGLTLCPVSQPLAGAPLRWEGPAPFLSSAPGLGGMLWESWAFVFIICALPGACTKSSKWKVPEKAADGTSEGKATQAPSWGEWLRGVTGALDGQQGWPRTGNKNVSESKKSLVVWCRFVGFESLLSHYLC